MANGVVAISGDRIIPIVGEEIDHGTVLIRDGRIEAIPKSPSGKILRRVLRDAAAQSPL